MLVGAAGAALSAAAAAAGATVARGWWYMCGKARAPLVARRVHRHAADLGAREHAAQRRHVAAQLLGAEVRPVRGLAEQRGALEVLTWIRCWWWVVVGEVWGWGVGMGRAPALQGRLGPGARALPTRLCLKSEDRPRPAPACTLTRASTSGRAAARGGACCCCCCCCCCSWTSSSMTRPSAAAPPAAA